MYDVFKGLVGCVLNGAPVVKDDNLYVLTSRGPFVFGAEGDCCARCYWDEVEVPADVDGAQVLSVEDEGWDRIDAPGDVEERCFVTIRTTAGAITATLRLSHNGYYGGWATLIRFPEAEAA